MSAEIAKAIRELNLTLEHSEEWIGSRSGKRDIHQAITALQSSCFHRLDYCDKNDKGYRYCCRDCGKLLKIRSGILMP